jgi:ketosteroid isomerase-like protein
MSNEQKNLVRRFTEEAWGNRDLSAALACAHSEIEIDWSASMGPFKDVYRGHEGLAQFWEALWEAWDEFAPQIEESIEYGDDRLITANQIRARGKASGVEVTSRGAVLWTFRDGKIASARLFQSRDDALEAVSSTP